MPPRGAKCQLNRHRKHWPCLYFDFPAAMLPSAAFLVAVNYVGCNHTLVVTFLTLSTSLGGISSCGIYINQIDIAPRWVSFIRQKNLSHPRGIILS